MNTAKTKLLVAGVLIAGGLTYLGYLSVSSAGQYAIGVKDYVTSPERYQNRGLRLAGHTVPGSWQTDGRKHEFVVVEAGGPGAAVAPDAKRIAVHFEGTMPDTFKEDMDVIVAGRMQGDTFVATEVMTQCASKYQGVDGNYIETALKKNGNS
jgi:cytochrome c-type biogenesis protein CcmE